MWRFAPSDSKHPSKRHCALAGSLAVLALLGSNVKFLGHLDSCYTHGKTRVPILSGPGGERSEELDPSACQVRCRSTSGCAHFDWWPDGGCYLSGEGAKEIDRPGVIHGPAMCGGGEPREFNDPSRHREADELWFIDGTYYDFEPMFKRHPGGKLPLQQTRGSDVSLLFRVQHISDRPRNALQRYAVPAQTVRGGARNLTSPKEYAFESDGFYMTLRRRVQQRLEEQKVTSVRNVGPLEIGKWSFNVMLFTWSWWRVVFYDFSMAVCLCNFFSRMVLTGQAHEGLHTILFPHMPEVQHFFSRVGLQFAGFPYDEWHLEHVLAHHPHTNTDIDPDIDLEQKIPVWRLSDQVPWSSLHTWPLLVTNLIGLGMPTANVLMRSSQLLLPFAVLRHEIIFACVCLLLLHWLPLFTRPLMPALKAVFFTSMLCGLLTLHAFHANHVTPTAQEVPFQPGVDWGEHQVRTTANFDAWVLSGGLDLQIEHHLFPMLSYTQQRNVQPIVMETCKEFGVPYYSSTSSLSHLGSMFSHLIALGWDGAAHQTEGVDMAGWNSSRTEM